MAIREPLVHEIAYKTWLINELGCDNIYVLEGTERSLVVDCGEGYCKLREIIESLTDKPYDVVVTHAHPDHVGAMHQFERIYINRKEVYDSPPRTQNGAPSTGGIDAFNWLTRKEFDMFDWELLSGAHVGNWEVWECDESSICRGELDTEVCFITEGQAFDLGGGRVVTAYDLPGHSPGHMYFVDSGARIAFTGDCVNGNNGTKYHAASTHIRYLQKFMSMYGVKFDRIFTGHCTYNGLLSVKSMDVETVRNLIEVHRAYLRGDVEYIQVPNRIAPAEGPMTRIAYGTGKNRVNVNVPPRKWEEGEEQLIP